MLRKVLKFLNITPSAFRRALSLSIPLFVALFCAFTWPPERTTEFGVFRYIDPLLTPLRGLEWSAYDSLFQWRGPVPADPHIMIVGFEKNTEKTLGTMWPGKRAYHAQVVRNLIADGAKVICFDILMQAPSEHGVEDDRAFDKALADTKALPDRKVIMACRVVRSGIDVQKTLASPYYDEKLGIDFEGNASIASVDILRGADQYVRTLYPVQKFLGEWLPSLPAAAYLAYAGGDISNTRVERSKILLGGHTIPRTGPTIPDPDFPENAMGSAYIDFPGGSNSFPIVRYDNVYRGEFEKGTFQDKVVFIGVTDIELAGALNDSLRTSYSHHSPTKAGANVNRDVFGVVVQAQLLNAMLQNRYIRMASPLEIFFCVFIFGNLANWAVIRFLNWRGPALVSLAIMGYVVTVFAIFVQWHIFIPFAVPSALLMLATAGVSWLERGEIVRKWSANVSPAYLEVLMKEGEDSFQPRNCDATVVFGDIRGFTHFSSRHDPAVVIDLLDKYLDKQVKIVFDEQGTIDKFLGDGIMVVFGAPNKQDDKELRAVRAAWRMRAASYEPVFDEQGNSYVLKEGLGIASGKLVLGFVGGRRLSSLTTIGDTVNMASRLQGVTGDADIILDEATYEKVKEDVEVEDLGEVQIKGKDDKIHCWRVTAVKGEAGGIMNEEKTSPSSNTRSFNRDRTVQSKE